MFFGILNNKGNCHCNCSFRMRAASNRKTALIEDKAYMLALDQIKIKAGILLGEVTGMTVIERVGQGAGRVNSAAKLKGKLRLTGSSKDQSVRIIIGKQLSKRIGL